MAIFYDTHAHLHYPDYEPDLPEALDRARAAGITKIIAVGIDLDSSQRAVAIADRYPAVYATVGWHPTHANEAPPDLRPALRELAQHPKVVAIGETGLDYYRHPKATHHPPDLDAYKRNQVRIFEQQLEVAAAAGLNAVIHQRESFADTIQVLARYAPQVQGQFHCFDNDASALQQVLELGSLVSFTGIITYKNRQPLRDLLASMPTDRFMFETDSPYLVPETLRGRLKRNEPSSVKTIAEAAALIRGCTPDELSQATCQTAARFFRRLA